MQKKGGEWVERTILSEKKLFVFEKKNCAEKKDTRSRYTQVHTVCNPNTLAD